MTKCLLVSISRGSTVRIFSGLTESKVSFYPFVCSKVNLTHRYYARKVQSHLKIHKLKAEWEEFLALPDDQQHLEKGNSKSALIQQS